LVGAYASCDHKLARRPAWEVATELAMRLTWEVVANIFALPR
jgi:hypothetical protein